MTSFGDFIPTEPDLINAFFEIIPVSNKDIVYDLGCGDGRLLFAAIEHGAGKGVGIDIDPRVIAQAKDEAIKRDMEYKVLFHAGNVLDINISEATVVFAYLLGEGAYALRPKFETELKPGTRIVMESFPVPGWKPKLRHIVPLEPGTVTFTCT